MGQGKIAGEGQLGMVVSGKACLSYKEFLARRGVWKGGTEADCRAWDSVG